MSVGMLVHVSVKWWNKIKEAWMEMCISQFEGFSDCKTLCGLQCNETGFDILLNLILCFSNHQAQSRHSHTWNVNRCRGLPRSFFPSHPPALKWVRKNSCMEVNKSVRTMFLKLIFQEVMFPKESFISSWQIEMHSEEFIDDLVIVSLLHICPFVIHEVKWNDSRYLRIHVNLGAVYTERF